MRKSKQLIIFLVILGFLMSLTACNGSSNTDSGGENDLVNSNSNGENNIGNDSKEPPEETEAPAPPPDFDPLPAERQPIEIETSDGRLLEGYYYPAKVPDAPVIVLMHWAGGTMDEDWIAIAPWLQNRQDELASVPSTKGISGLVKPAYIEPWQDNSWFPPLPESTSFAVVIFNFGKFGASPYGGTPQSLVDDALSAVKFASSIEGIDPNRISTMGASIGADAAVDACYLFNMEDLGLCIGALSLSPGNYLTEEFLYYEAVAVLDMDGVPVWCLASESDHNVPEVCRSASGDNYQVVIFAGEDHGMLLVTPDHKPIDPASDFNTLQLYLEFLEVVYGFDLIE
jgi:hypothetical protein